MIAINNLTGRNSGRYKFIEANIVLKAHELEEAAFIAMVTIRIKDCKMIKQEILTNPFPHVGQGKEILLAEFLIRDSVDAVITRERFAGMGPFYVFSNAAVDTYKTREDTVENALAQMGVHDV